MSNLYNHIYARVQYHGSPDVIDLVIHDCGPKSLDDFLAALANKCSTISIITRYRSKVFNDNQVSQIHIN